jgi:hypothetical protein
LPITSYEVTQIAGTASPDVLVGTAIGEVIGGYKGQDTLTGGGGRDQFLYTETSDGVDIITDFAIGQDQIDLSQIIQNETNYRQDDPLAGTSNRTFNFSGADQGDANGNNLGQTSNLQTFLGLAPNTLNIPRQGGSIPGTRTPKEGSAIQQTITLTKDSIIKFNWNYLTNDGTHPIFGNQDYSFVTIYNVNSNPSDRPVQILGDSTGNISTPISSGQTSFEKAGGYQSYDSPLLPPGTYVIGAGVVDVDGTGISSGLLIDNFEVVPFDFSATTGLGLVTAVFGLSRLRRRFSS